MKKLFDIVELTVDNEKCVVLSVKQTSSSFMDLISLGWFTGIESTIRVTKGHDHIITIWNQKHEIIHESKDSSSKNQLIINCINEDFGIDISGCAASLQEVL